MNFREVVIQMCFLKNFPGFIGKHLCVEVPSYLRRESDTSVFLRMLQIFFPFFIELLRWLFLLFFCRVSVEDVGKGDKEISTCVAKTHTSI